MSLFDVVYILVVSEEKNIVDVDKIRKCILVGEKFQPEYMKKLEKYIFKEASVRKRICKKIYLLNCVFGKLCL